jgi:crotonobetainyl-CoA:carnitine CoA-transferase CaiB-like acyl-CoA transferase
LKENQSDQKIGPLQGLKVLELGNYVAAPFCCRLLADLGAEVIKVEPPKTGDPVRAWGEMLDDKSVWWSMHGRNKKCITLNLKHEKARILAKKLVAQSDIVVENYRPGQLERFGLGPDVIEKIRPSCILVRISGYGQSGPYKSKAAFGSIGEALGGIRYLTGYPKDITDLSSVRTGVSIGDNIAGLYGAFGALSALTEVRMNPSDTSVRIVDVALTESILSMLDGCVPEYGVTGKIREPAGAALSTTAPSNAYRCLDGVDILIAANSTSLFNSLCKVMQKPQLISDRRFMTNSKRVEYMKILDIEINQWTMQHTSKALIERLEKENIPSSKIYTVADIVNDPQYQSRKAVQSVRDDLLGTDILQTAPMPFFSEGRNGKVRWTGPSIGQHNHEVLSALLHKDDDLDSLEAEGVL